MEPPALFANYGRPSDQPTDLRAHGEATLTTTGVSLSLTHALVNVVRVHVENSFLNHLLFIISTKYYEESAYTVKT